MKKWLSVPLALAGGLVVLWLLFGVGRGPDKAAPAATTVNAVVKISGEQIIDDDVDTNVKGACERVDDVVTYKVKTPEVDVTLSSRPQGKSRVTTFHIHTDKTDIYSPDELKTPAFNGQWQANLDCQNARVVGSITENRSENSPEIGQVSVIVGKD